VLTLPAAACIGALTYGVTRIFGTGAVGPVIVSVLILAGSIFLFTKRAQQSAGVTAASEA
jgi:PiT family inorganic phosphate transporter